MRECTLTLEVQVRSALNKAVGRDQDSVCAVDGIDVVDDRSERRSSLLIGEGRVNHGDRHGTIGVLRENVRHRVSLWMREVRT